MSNKPNLYNNILSSRFISLKSDKKTIISSSTKLHLFEGLIMEKSRIDAFASIVERKNKREKQQMLKENSPHRINVNSSTDSMHHQSNLASKTVLQRQRTPSKMGIRREKETVRGGKSRQKGAQSWKHRAVLQLTQKLLQSISSQVNDRRSQSHQTTQISLNALQLHRISEIQQLLSDLGHVSTQPDRALAYQMRDQDRKSPQTAKSRQINEPSGSEKYIEEVKFMHSIVQYQQQEIKEVSAQLFTLRGHYMDLLLSLEMKERDNESKDGTDLPSFGTIQPFSVRNPENSQERLRIQQLDLKEKSADEANMYEELVSVNQKLRELNVLMDNQLAATTERVEALNQESSIMEEYLAQITQKIATHEQYYLEKQQKIQALQMEVELEQQNLGRVQDQLTFLEEQCQLVQSQIPSC